MNRRLVPVLLLLVAAIALPGTTTRTKAEEGYTLRIASLAPAGSSWMKVLNAWNKTLQEKTDGKLKMRFYPGGSQGDEAHRIADELRDDGLTVEIDDREGLKPGAKYYHWERMGVPLRLEIGPRDVAAGTVMAKRRLSELDERGRPVKEKLPMEDIGISVGKVLDEFQQHLLDRALAFREANTVTVDTWDEFQEVFAGGASKFVYAHWDGTDETELAIKQETKATIRLIPLPGEGPEPEPGSCIKTGKPSAQRVLYAKNY